MGFRISSDEQRASDAPFPLLAPVLTHTVVMVTNLTVWATATDQDLNITMADTAVITEEVEMDLSPSELVTGDAVQMAAHTTTSRKMSIASDAVQVVQLLCSRSTIRTPTLHPWHHHQTLVWHHLQAQWETPLVLLHTAQVRKLLVPVLHSLNRLPTALECTLVWPRPVQASLRWAA